MQQHKFIFAEVGVAVGHEVEGGKPPLAGDLHEREVAFPLEEEAFQGEAPCVEGVGVASFQGEESYLGKKKIKTTSKITNDGIITRRGHSDRRWHHSRGRHHPRHWHNRGARTKSKS